MYSRARLKTSELPRFMAEYQGSLKIQPGDPPGFLYQDKNSKNRDSRKMMNKAEEILKRMGELAEPV